MTNAIITPPAPNPFISLTGHLSDLIRIFLEENSEQFQKPIHSLRLTKLQYALGEKHAEKYCMRFIARVQAQGEKETEIIGLTFTVSNVAERFTS